MRRKWTWTELQDLRLKAVCKIIDDLKDYWPLTVRQIHYRLFAKKVPWGGRRESDTYQNKVSCYGDLIKICKFGRLQRLISWHAIEDAVRVLYEPYKFTDLQDYLKNEVEHYILTDYMRCRVQDQKYYVEVWLEKHALWKIFRRAIEGYCVPLIACRGYDSITFLKNFADNAKQALWRGQTPVVLYFGDLDPSGVDMFEASVETLCNPNEFGLIRGSVDFTRVAVNPINVIAHDLPNDPKAGKKKDKRYKKHVERFGEVFVELDALEPSHLERLVRGTLEGIFDMEALQEQRTIEKKEKERLYKVRQKIASVINQEFGTQFSI
jgi:hypothetical protein